MPGFLTASNWEERKAMNIDCDKVYPGIFLANGETIQNVDYLKESLYSYFIITLKLASVLFVLLSIAIDIPIKHTANLELQNP